MTSGAAGGVVLMVAGIVWWLVVGALTDRGEKAAPLSARAWAGAGLYAVGTIPVMAGIGRLQEASGWPGAIAGMGVAVAVVALVFLVLLLAVRAGRRVRRRDRR